MPTLTSPRTTKAPRKALPPPRVRKEPPTIAEAVLAAEGLSTDPQEQLEIAAGLMGVSPDEVKPFLPPPRSARTVSIMAGHRSVVVEHRPARSGTVRAVRRVGF